MESDGNQIYSQMGNRRESDGHQMGIKLGLDGNQMGIRLGLDGNQMGTKCVTHMGDGIRWESDGNEMRDGNQIRWESDQMGIRSDGNQMGFMGGSNRNALIRKIEKVPGCLRGLPLSQVKGVGFQRIESV